MYPGKLEEGACVIILELLKNSMIQINKTASNVHFNTAETDKELILQQLYFIILKIVYIFIRPWLLLGRNDFF
ncbi:hypothetical protein B9T54_03185 [Leptospira borgpetersenii serovar Hardjo-bovis]|nr:hypothetical protein B9T54_03185 [Leptospira borgpetersenii serovar Hardjo-bovis]